MHDTNQIGSFTSAIQNLPSTSITHSAKHERKTDKLYNLFDATNPAGFSWMRRPLGNHVQITNISKLMVDAGRFVVYAFTTFWNSLMERLESSRVNEMSKDYMQKAGFGDLKSFPYIGSSS